MSQVGARSFADMLRVNRVLTGLVFEGNRIGAEGGMYLCEALENNHSLTRLNVASCNLRKTGGLSISSMLRKNSALEELIVKKNGLTSQGIQVIIPPLVLLVALLTPYPLPCLGPCRGLETQRSTEETRHQRESH